MKRPWWDSEPPWLGILIGLSMSLDGWRRITVGIALGLWALTMWTVARHLQRKLQRAEKLLEQADALAQAARPFVVGSHAN